MKILDDKIVIDWLLKENQYNTGKLMPNGMKCDVEFSVISMQTHINHGCSCKITQDKKGSWLFPCKKHTDKANEFRDGKIIHQRL